MLNKGLRDEEKIRIDNVLKTLRTLVFVPQPLNDLDKTNIENQLKEFALNIETLVDHSNEDLIELLIHLHFDWEQLEQFGDILIKFSKAETYNFEEKGLAVYQYIQAESKVFSFWDKFENCFAKKQIKMRFTDWKTDRIENILPEEFYKLIDKNKHHIEKTFPVTLANSDSLSKAKDFLVVNLDKEKNKEGFYFFTRNIKTNELIGYLCVKSIDYRISKCELGYFIDKDFQGKGITTKMVSDALDFCFNELLMNKVFICTSEINLASQRIALKHNFKQEGILRDEFRNGDGELQDTVYFGLLKSEYIRDEQ